MPMSISEKILAAHSDPSEAKPGALIQARLDFVFCQCHHRPRVDQGFKGPPALHAGAAEGRRPGPYVRRQRKQDAC